MMHHPTPHKNNAHIDGHPPKKEAENPLKRHKEEEKGQEKEDEYSQKIASLTELLQRNRAEFENYQKRTEKEKQALFVFAQAETIKEILPFWDSLEEAIKTENKEEKKALEPLAKQFREILQKTGVKPMEVIGKKFDHEKQDCLLTEHNQEKPDGIVLEELQKGFFFKETVLRHAKVKVNKIKEEKKEEKNTEEKNKEDENA